MADITTTITKSEILPNSGLKKFIIITPATSDSADTFTFTLASNGCVSFLGITGWTHTTANSVVIGQTDMTTAVSSGVLTVTTGGGPGNTDKIRVYELTCL